MKGDENHGMVYVYELIVNDLKKSPEIRLKTVSYFFFEQSEK